MQMVKRLLLVFSLILLISGCAKKPVAELQDIRSIVAHAYAAGAAQQAPAEYQLASSALQAAELQVRDGDYRQAVKTLELVRRYSAEAMRKVKEHKLVEEERRVAAEKRLAELKQQQEIERQEEQKRERERKRKSTKQQQEKTVPVIETSIKVKKKRVLVDEVEVQAGENLATLAAREEVYGDALLWPLIYKANRDQVKNPEEIFAGQIFVVPRDKSNDEADAARQEARELNLF